MMISVFDGVDCAGDGMTVNINDMLSSSCMSNVLMSCQEEPMAMTEQW
jgi:hypothetical protein